MTAPRRYRPPEKLRGLSALEKEQSTRPRLLRPWSRLEKQLFLAACAGIALKILHMWLTEPLP